ncbi:MAG TPA: NAD-dependent epimerase/dehydratase family protein [Thermomicrobiales bacterium]|nr:NAD-dependent epimerase/dehydratase family protein [Thermomicrobiales bacterium]
MRILLVDPPALIDAPLREALAGHDVVAFAGDVRDLATCAAQAECDVVVHAIPASDDPLAMLDRASRGTWNLLTTTRATRYVLLSSMRLFDTYGDGWHITEAWAPRPATDAEHLAPYLAEVASREISRARPLDCRVLRLDEVVSAERFAAGPVAWDWLHVEDAVAAIERAITVETASATGDRWSPLHIVRGGLGSRFPAGEAAREPFAFAARHPGDDHAPASGGTPAFPSSQAPVTDVPLPERVVILGAGGPLGAITTRCLEHDHRLRLTDIRPLAEIAAAPPQSEGAPLPAPASAPHEELIVDVTDPDAILAATEGMDTIVNCTVMRHDPVQAFRVNTLGAYNVMRAAVAHGIRRVVHTGPVLTLAPHPAGYTEDRDVASDVPPRPGDNLYFVSKLLGQEIVRIFAEHHGIACPTLLFCGFVDPEVALRTGQPPGPFTISWKDSGRAMAAATRLRAVPAPFTVVHVMADAPHDRFRNDAARRVLGWEPRDRLDHLWYRRRR